MAKRMDNMPQVHGSTVELTHHTERGYTMHILSVWGELACFSRPELKVERWSYPCPTPSAARGIFDAIYAKPPEFRWQVRRIEVLEPPGGPPGAEPISYIALRRNEVKDVVNLTAVEKAMAGKAEIEPIWADGDKALLGSDERGRTQRQTMALRNVRYRLWADIVPWPGFEGRRAALGAQFRRRASQGKCFQQPYLGCREFPAWFELTDESAVAAEPPAPVDMDLGFMLYDVFDLSRPGSATDGPCITLFRAQLRGGVLDVPPFDDPAVLKPVEEGSPC